MAAHWHIWGGISGAEYLGRQYLGRGCHTSNAVEHKYGVSVIR